jgi:hypothetical protein
VITELQKDWPRIRNKVIMKFSEFYILTDNLPFTVALAIVSLLSLIEGVAFLIGFGLINFLDSLLPDIDFNIDGPKLTDPGIISKTLSFLRIKKIPVIILFVTFLMSFGVSGLMLQVILLKVLGTTMNGLLLTIPAIILGIAITKGFSEVIARLMPKDETDAETLNSFIGKVAIITLGVAKPNHPAQCKLKDKKGTTHYLMVMPDKDQEIQTGEKVLFVKYEEPYFYGIKPENENI